MVKVLVVDDSAFVRRSLTTLLEKDPDISVVATAANGEQAIEMNIRHDPDVITMDVEMPRMDGLTALEKIMAEHPCPVIMVSSLTSEGADVTLRALDLGALDFVSKLASGSLPDLAVMQKELTGKVKALARRKGFMRLMFNRHKDREARRTRSAPVGGRAAAAPAPHQAPPPAGSGGHPGQADSPISPLPRSLRAAFDVVAIGVSTGGPPAVQKVLSQLPSNFPAPLLIAQHMPAAFTGPFAKRLNAQSPIEVKEAEDMERLRPGTAYICPGGRHLRLESRAGLLCGLVSDEPKDALYKPSANVLMESAGMVSGRKALGITLTGMGNDGLLGTRVLKERGGKVIAQSEASCVVYGMPKAVVDAGLADVIADIDDMAATIISFFDK
ncbi:chemotaxis response regulator protein-glutamate methylesterase [Desulfovibrio sp. OttesenSCG-928-A18]|nr:chemotaxis response regulator protein-glutamate methylesterase [Desulfovibrio sp. OttesenSCG-928-A18]